MKIKTSEATPLQLNWLVSKCKGIEVVMRHDYMRGKASANNYKGDLQWQLDIQPNEPIWIDTAGGTHEMSQYTEDWSQGGPIIECEKITAAFDHDNYEDRWTADKLTETCNNFHNGSGPTLLIAGMRCYVASKLGEEVEVPEELI